MIANSLVHSGTPPWTWGQGVTNPHCLGSIGDRKRVVTKTNTRVMLCPVTSEKSGCEHIGLIDCL